MHFVQNVLDDNEESSEALKIMSQAIDMYDRTTSLENEGA